MNGTGWLLVGVAAFLVVKKIGGLIPAFPSIPTVGDVVAGVKDQVGDGLGAFTGTGVTVDYQPAKVYSQTELDSADNYWSNVFDFWAEDLTGSFK